MTAAILWSSARHREELGQSAPGARVHALLVRLYALETDETALGWLKTYRDAAPAKPARHGAKSKRSSDGAD